MISRIDRALTSGLRDRFPVFHRFRKIEMKKIIYMKQDELKNNTHTMEKRLKQVAYFVAEGLKELHLPGISRHIVLPEIADR